MKMIALAAVGGLAVATAAAGTVTAFTLSAATDTVVTANVANHPDNGHGTPSLWALDTFKRTMVIHKNGTDDYTIKTTDSGTFTTTQGAGSPSGAAGVQISRKLTGAFSSTGIGHVTGGALVTNPGQFSNKSFNDAGGTPFPGSGAWANKFFAPGAAVSPFDHYTFRYQTADEKWVDADTNNDGQAASAGNITGKLSSHLTAKNKCRIKGTNHNRWSVTNDRGDRSRGFVYRVGYKGKWSAKATGTVAAGKTVTFTTPTGGYLSVFYMDGYNQRIFTSARSKYDTVC